MECRLQRVRLSSNRSAVHDPDAGPFLEVEALHKPRSSGRKSAPSFQRSESSGLTSAATKQGCMSPLRQHSRRRLLAGGGLSRCAEDAQLAVGVATPKRFHRPA